MGSVPGSGFGNITIYVQSMGTDAVPKLSPEQQNSLLMAKVGLVSALCACALLVALPLWLEKGKIGLAALLILVGIMTLIAIIGFANFMYTRYRKNDPASKNAKVVIIGETEC